MLTTERLNEIERAAKEVIDARDAFNIHFAQEAAGCLPEEFYGKINEKWDATIDKVLELGDRSDDILTLIQMARSAVK